MFSYPKPRLVGLKNLSSREVYREYLFTFQKRTIQVGYFSRTESFNYLSPHRGCYFFFPICIPEDKKTGLRLLRLRLISTRFLHRLLFRWNHTLPMPDSHHRQLRLGNLRASAIPCAIVSRSATYTPLFFMVNSSQIWLFC